MLFVPFTFAAFENIPFKRKDVAVESFSDRIHDDTFFKHNRIPKKSEKSGFFLYLFCVIFD